MKKPNKKEILKAFIEKNDILIVDKNPGSRNRLIKILSDLGSKRHMMHSVGSLQESIEIIQTKNIGIILSDYFIVGGSGFDLFKLIRSKNPEKKNCLILVTSDLSQSSVAKAAEEDVDSFIIKPFTVDSIQENLVNTIADKISPPPYIILIEEAKDLIKDTKYDEAIGILNKALVLHSKPALALFYIGQAEYLKNLEDKSQANYKQGLSYNNIHFKCLLGLFDLLMNRNDFIGAYEVVSKISKYFPASPERLQQVIKLAVQTHNFQDMQFYYDIFTTLDERPKAVINYIGAGLYISAKHFLLNNSPAEALKLFEQIGISCSEYTKFLRAIISLLAEHGMAEEAEKYLKRFDTGSRKQEDYLVSDFLVDSLIFKDPNRAIKNGLDLYNKKIRDYQCMQKMIQSMKASGYQEDKILPYIKEMKLLWPERFEDHEDVAV